MNQRSDKEITKRIHSKNKSSETRIPESTGTTNNSFHCASGLPCQTALSFDSYSLGYRSCRLRNHDGENTIFQARLDPILVNSGWETEGPLEFTYGAFADPVFMAGSSCGNWALG